MIFDDEGQIENPNEDKVLSNLSKTPANIKKLNILKVIEKPQENNQYLLRSIFERNKYTIFFPYPLFCNERRDTSRVIQDKCEAKFKVSENTYTYNCVKNSLKYAGFIQTNSKGWNILWSNPLKPENLQYFHKNQRCNHFPSTWQIGRKDNLWRNVSKYFNLE